MMNRKLYKSNENKMIEGVCGGIAEFFGIYHRCHYHPLQSAVLKKEQREVS